MRIFLIALLAAISYAQTVGLHTPCEMRMPANCKGPSPEGEGRVCMMDMHESPPACVDGMAADPEDYCAGYMTKVECDAVPACCFNLEGQCEKFDVEDCSAAAMAPQIFSGMGIMGGGAPQIPNFGFPAMMGGEAPEPEMPEFGFPSNGFGFPSGFGPPSVPQSSPVADGVVPQAPVQSQGSSASQNNVASMFPMLHPNPPLSERQLTMACDTLVMQGPDVCNSKFLANGRICVWDVRERQCSDTQIGYGNMCKGIGNRNECNKYMDCCWDFEQYCDEIDTGDCPTGRIQPAFPFIANLPIPGIPGVFTPETPTETQSGSSEGINAGDSNFGPDEGNTGSSEPAVDETAAGRGSEAVSEATGEGETEAVNAGEGETEAVNAGEGETEVTNTGEGEVTGSGSEVDTEASIGLGSLPQVESCVDLEPAACHGRVDYNPCIIDQDGKCIKMTFGTSAEEGAPTLRRTHQIETAPNHTHNKYLTLSLFACGGLLLGVVAAICFNNIKPFTSSTSQPVLLDEYHRKI